MDDPEYEGDEFVGRGRGDEVPEYLRWQGLVRNRAFTVAEAHVLIFEIMEKKMRFDAKRPANRPPCSSCVPILAPVPQHALARPCPRCLERSRHGCRLGLACRCLTPRFGAPVFAAGRAR